MIDRQDDKMVAQERALEIANRVLVLQQDPLLACRELDQLRHALSDLPNDIMDVFAGVSSEIDELPLGNARQHWDAAVLSTLDVKAAAYRDQVRPIVEDALRCMLSAIGHPS